MNTPRYGIEWYVGDGEHDYKLSGTQEFATLRELLEGLVTEGTKHFDEDLLFDALDAGRQERIYWITDDFGFAFYLPKQPLPREPAAG